ncbi:MAG: hypothetical protein MJA83_17380, partial [Gammaproteobacteria bacterium]|nr:hypothetical protein [Gammaproteobacteria bacterium]
MRSEYCGEEGGEPGRLSNVIYAGAFPHSPYRETQIAIGGAAADSGGGGRVFPLENRLYLKKLRVKVTDEEGLVLPSAARGDGTVLQFDMVSLSKREVPLFLSSKSSLAHYPQNTAVRFRTVLQRDILVERGASLSLESFACTGDVQISSGLGQEDEEDALNIVFRTADNRFVINKSFPLAGGDEDRRTLAAANSINELVGYVNARIGTLASREREEGLAKIVGGFRLGHLTTSKLYLSHPKGA